MGSSTKKTRLTRLKKTDLELKYKDAGQPGEDRSSEPRKTDPELRPISSQH